MTLSDAQIERYSRQIIVPGIGSRGQTNLLAASVVVHGAPRLVTATAAHLAAAGVGNLWIAIDESPADAVAQVAAVNGDCRVQAAVPETTADLSIHCGATAMAFRNAKSCVFGAIVGEQIVLSEIAPPTASAAHASRLPTEAALAAALATAALRRLIEPDAPPISSTYELS